MQNLRSTHRHQGYLSVGINGERSGSCWGTHRAIGARIPPPLPPRVFQTLRYSQNARWELPQSADSSGRVYARAVKASDKRG